MFSIETSIQGGLPDIKKIRILSKTLNNIGKKVISDIKAKTPVKTGKLKQSIKYEIGKNKVVFSSEIPYCIFVELGHFTKGRKKFIPGRFMFRDGIFSNTRYVEKEIVKDLKKQYKDIKTL